MKNLLIVDRMGAKRWKSSEFREKQGEHTIGEKRYVGLKEDSAMSMFQGKSALEHGKQSSQNYTRNYGKLHFMITV